VSDFELTLKGSAAHDEWVADWDDVLRRAGSSPSRSRRVAAIGVLVAVALVLTLPGIGVGGRLKDLIAGSKVPGLQLRADLVRQGGRSIGSLSLSTSRLLVAIAPRTGRVRSFVPGHGPLRPAQIRWTLHLDGGTTAASARIVGVARLCSPCSDGRNGTIRARRGALAALFGKPTVVVETSQGAARGTLRLQTPMR